MQWRKITVLLTDEVNVLENYIHCLDRNVLYGHTVGALDEQTTSLKGQMFTEGTDISRCGGGSLGRAGSDLSMCSLYM